MRRGPADRLLEGGLTGHRDTHPDRRGGSHAGAGIHGIHPSGSRRRGLHSRNLLATEGRIAATRANTALGGLGDRRGLFLMGILIDSIFKPLLGAMILTIVARPDIARRAAKVELRAESRVFAAVLGILAGGFTMIANAAGPVMTIYLLSMKLRKEEFVGTGMGLLHYQSVQASFQHSLGARDLGHAKSESRAPPAGADRKPDRRAGDEEDVPESLRPGRPGPRRRGRDPPFLLMDSPGRPVARPRVGAR